MHRGRAVLCRLGLVARPHAALATAKVTSSASSDLDFGSIVSADAPQHEVEVRHLFTYGTLRPDDVKGAPWTKRFREGVRWRRAVVHNARLFADRYPFVVLSPPDQRQEEEPTAHANYVVGYVMCCDNQDQFQAKMMEADAIEGYPHYYQRSIVEAVIDDQEEDSAKPWFSHHPNNSVTASDGQQKEREIVRCYIYHRQREGRRDEYPVLCGDWIFVGLQNPETPTDRLFQTEAGRRRTTKLG